MSFLLSDVIHYSALSQTLNRSNFGLSEISIIAHVCSGYHMLLNNPGEGCSAIPVRWHLSTVFPDCETSVGRWEALGRTASAHTTPTCRTSQDWCGNAAKILLEARQNPRGPEKKLQEEWTQERWVYRDSKKDFFFIVNNIQLARFRGFSCHTQVTWQSTIIFQPLTARQLAV